MPRFSQADAADLDTTGLSQAEALRQIEILSNPPAAIRLLRPCLPADGIVQLDEARTDLVERWRQALESGRLSKFVPASGAATRMFGLLTASGSDTPATLEALEHRAASGDAEAAALVELLEKLPGLPFFEALAHRAHGETGEDWRDLRASRPLLLLSLLADTEGVDLAAMPKGLVPFHRYGTGTRTALEEHADEASHYLTGGNRRRMDLHFTVSEEHLDAFRRAADDIEAELRAASGLDAHIGLSTQDPSTRTLALDAAGQPARGADGRLLLRPGGHGALISNLARFAAAGGDVIFIKNIDNVARRRDHSLVGLWKRLLSGLLLELKQESDGLLQRLETARVGSGAAADAQYFLAHRLAVKPPPAFSQLDHRGRIDYLRARLDRPLRVCGVVANRGEPGGGPFWVRRADGSEDAQVVESAQIDGESAAQRAIWAEATHFNPVDVVCAVRDRHGRPYDLTAFIDQSAAIISRKLHSGSTISVLERPGLWNGAMADWNTSFVEVPEATFTPVKTIVDLLRPAHQPASRTR